MSAYQELLAQKAELDRKIEQARRKELADAIAQIRALMQQYGITVADLGGKVKAPRSLGKVPPKYRDPATGATWTGRGRQPKWVEAALKSGKALAQLAI